MKILGENDWKNAASSKVKKTKNDCHSYNRFNCYLDDKDLQNEIKSNELKTVNAHIFYKSVECATDVLSGSYVKYSLFLVAVIIAFIF